MSNRLNLMDLKQIIIGYANGQSVRSIASTTGIARNTVGRYVKWAKESSYTLEQLRGMEEASLKQLFVVPKQSDASRYEALMGYFEKMHEARKYPGFTFKHHYVEYKRMVDNPYGYTQFLNHYRAKYSVPKGSMKLSHSPGEQLYIDFAGKRLSVRDKETGKDVLVEVFVAIFPFSQYTYVQACSSQKRSDLIGCCEGALRFYGGVPKAIVSDNLKAAVSRASKYESKINRCFKDFADHYGCVVNPTRVYRPQDKALVEHAVRLTYQRIYYPMREMTFFSLDDLNAEIRKHLAVHNGRALQHRDSTRQELFSLVEATYLSVLPQGAFVLKGYCRATVQKMGYVLFSVDKVYYSVPFRYIGQKTLIHYTDGMLEVYYEGERIAIHKRCSERGSYVTDDAHLRDSHKRYKGLSPAYFIARAAKRGEHVSRFVERVFKASNYPPSCYPRVRGLLRLAHQYSTSRLNMACGMALGEDTVSCHRVRELLEQALDKRQEAEAQAEEQVSSIPVHENIRGSGAYK